MASKDQASQVEWNVVSTADEPETKIVFDTLGDEWIGEFLGPRTVGSGANAYTQYRFRGQDGEIYFTNAGYSLRMGMKSVRPGSLVKLTFADTMDTGQDDPMKVFEVAVARRGKTTVSDNS